MGGRSRQLTWTTAFAAGLFLRPVLIVPMASAGPLRDSEWLPVALASVFLSSGLLAALVVLGNRLALAFGILTALLGVPLALVGIAVGLPMPWPVVMAGYNAVIAVVGILGWEEPRRPG